MEKEFSELFWICPKQLFRYGGKCSMAVLFRLRLVAARLR
jgi:hypothetical protein